MLSPLSLIWFLPIGGIITLLYLLKQKRRDVRVPSLMLWEQVLAETASAAPFQKLRVDPLLILQLLAALLFCIALARPFVLGNSVRGKNVVLVLDGSASMGATDTGGTRFRSAVEAARKAIEAKTPQDNIAIVMAGIQPLVLSPLSADKSRLLSALQKATPDNSVNGPREALLLAGSLVSSRTDALVVFFTDGAFARQEELSLGGATLTTVPIGKGTDNIGVTAFEVRAQAEGDGWEAFVTILNADIRERTVPLLLQADDSLLDAREITVPAGESRSLTVSLAASDIPATADLLTAKIDISDELATDNIAYAALPNRQEIPILLVATDDDPFLERALSLIPRVKVTKISPVAFRTESLKGQDLTIWDNDVVPPSDLPPGRYLFFGSSPVGKISPVSADIGPLNSPTVLDWDRASPLLRFANVSGLRIRTAHKIRPAPWGSVVMESKDSPLMVLGEKGYSRVLYVAFRPQQTDFPLRVAFPVFVANAVSYLAGHEDSDGASVIRPGNTVRLPAGATVVDDHGDEQPVGAGVFQNRGPIGVYQIKVATKERSRFAVSLLSPIETRITPEIADKIPLVSATNADQSAEKSQKVPLEWWPYLAATLLVLLSAEWVVFYRRKR